MPQPRLFVSAPLSAGATVLLEEGQSRYLAQVLRLGVGARLRVFNGVDGEWLATIERLDKKNAAIRAEVLRRAQSPTPDLWLLFAPIKRQGTDLIAEKSAELGVSVLQPVITRRTIAETVRIDRLRAIAIEASEQTERLDLPDIREPVALPRALEGWDRARALVFADEAGDDPTETWGGAQGRATPILAALGARAPRPGRFALLIGPEGGFEPEERALLRSLPFVTPVTLGPRILRAETAAIAALSVLQSAWGDWR